jgi:hypothetical protein
MLLVNACMQNEGEFIVEYVHNVSYIHAFMSCGIFISSWGDYDVLLASCGDGLDVVGVGTACM